MPYLPLKSCEWHLIIYFILICGIRDGKAADPEGNELSVGLLTMMNFSSFSPQAGTALYKSMKAEFTKHNYIWKVTFTGELTLRASMLWLRAYIHRTSLLGSTPLLCGFEQVT